MTKPEAKEQGMTLLEVMVALVIFSIAALALMNSVSLNVRLRTVLPIRYRPVGLRKTSSRKRSLQKAFFPTSLKKAVKRWVDAAGTGANSG